MASYQDMVKRIDKMSDEELTSVWTALQITDWVDGEPWSTINEDGEFELDGPTMLSWAETIYSEYCKRDLQGR